MRSTTSSNENVNIDEERGRISMMCSPHIASFNWFIDIGLEKLEQHLPFFRFRFGGTSIQYRLGNIRLEKPLKASKELSRDRRLFPREARGRLLTYKGQILADILYRVNNGHEEKISLGRRLGSIPIMVSSKSCHLEGMSTTELISLGEEPMEAGGYFIVNGNEKLVRLLIVPRSNYPLAVERSSYSKRGKHFTPFAIQMRSMRQDMSSQTTTLHYTSTGNMIICLSVRKQQYFIPLGIMLRALYDSSDAELYSILIGSMVHDAFIVERAELILREGPRNCEVYTKIQCLKYLGKVFRIMYDAYNDDDELDTAHRMLSDHFLVHSHLHSEKFNSLVIMTHKLFEFVRGNIVGDNPDALSNQQLLLPGHLMCMKLKEDLEEWLRKFLQLMEKDALRSPDSNQFLDSAYLRRIIQKNPVDITKRMEYFLATGNLKSVSGLDQMQVAGFTVLAEKLNFLRFLSHFNSVHRGAYFTTMKTTTVRKLLPESWGFICPVHTPDGAPCGLLLHLSRSCRVSMFRVHDTESRETIINYLSSLGLRKISVHRSTPVILDGVVIGYFKDSEAENCVNSLRKLKMSSAVPLELEIAYVHRYIRTAIEEQRSFRTKLIVKSSFSGLFLFNCPGRFMRPVQMLRSSNPYENECRSIELIGSLEQCYLDILLCEPSNLKSRMLCHFEISSSEVFSIAALLTPYSEYNQSPRNIYQCQMGKQTMGTPMLSLPLRVDNKIYRIQSPQSPIVRCAAYDSFGMDAYAMGTNSIVAVISHTGYDMEDAMIINKSSVERGLYHGSVYVSKVIDLGPSENSLHFGFQNSNVLVRTDSSHSTLDVDGFPPIGQRIRPGGPLYCYYNAHSKSYKTEYLKGHETGFVEEIHILGSDGRTQGRMNKAIIKMRFCRNPIVGDKFSSRHGQKGTCSWLWPDENMPFTERGLRPDCIINPHAFPSRMTIGMLIESLASKCGAVLGAFFDGSPFQFSDNLASSYYGDLLKAVGYNRRGLEVVYNGQFGVPMQCDIYIGPVYYQRLRHMIKDKFQIRSTGPNDGVTRQPIHGRKVGGGIRFGEMERDALIAHGVSYTLQDRMFYCSDYHTSNICTKCGSILTIHKHFNSHSSQLHCKQDSLRENGIAFPPSQNTIHDDMYSCRRCGHGRCSVTAEFPYVFLYLVNELAAMNIVIKLNVC